MICESPSNFWRILSALYYTRESADSYWYWYCVTQFVCTVLYSRISWVHVTEKSEKRETGNCKSRHAHDSTIVKDWKWGWIPHPVDEGLFQVMNISDNWQSNVKEYSWPSFLSFLSFQASTHWQPVTSQYCDNMSSYSESNFPPLQTIHLLKQRKMSVVSLPIRELANEVTFNVFSAHNFLCVENI